MSEESVKIVLRLSDSKFGKQDERDVLEKLGRDLEAIIQEEAVGEFDGVEFGAGECVFYTYGSDADRLFETIRGVLAASPAARGGYVLKRYGPPDPNVPEVRVDL